VTEFNPNVSAASAHLEVVVSHLQREPDLESKVLTKVQSAATVISAQALALQVVAQKHEL